MELSIYRLSIQRNQSSDQNIFFKSSNQHFFRKVSMNRVKKNPFIQKKFRKIMIKFNFRKKKFNQKNLATFLE